MNFNEAKNILINHNLWRRDQHIPNKYEMVNPTELGKAIDVAIEALCGCIDLECTSYEDLVSLYRELGYLRSHNVE